MLRLHGFPTVGLWECWEYSECKAMLTFHAEVSHIRFFYFSASTSDFFLINFSRIKMGCTDNLKETGLM